jgi:rare lipoprotein A (peptidoglycan hydrolase)
MTITTVLLSLVSPLILAYAPTTSEIKDVLTEMMPTTTIDVNQLKYNSPKVYTANSDSYTVLASWYGPNFDGGQTASGETFNQYDYTTAHPSLPFGTQLEITYKGRSVVVRVNDRGPYYGGRELDISLGAAQAIGFVDVGEDYVTVTELN